MARVLDSLIELHKIDQQLVEVQRETERLPEALAEAEQELTALEEKRTGILQEARDKQVAADKSDVTVKDLQGKIEKYQVQLNIAKTQKEYDTLKHEIAAAEEQISEIETGALTAMEEADELGGRAREMEPEAAAVKKKLDTARGELDDRLADLAHKREKLERQRAEHVKTVGEDELKLYELVRTKHKDGAMVLVRDGRCTICNINLTPQSWNMVLIGETPQQCRSCGRICFNEESPADG